jgi:hypothetical protein
MPPLSNTVRVVAAGAALSLSACDPQRQPTAVEPLPPPDNPPAQPGEEPPAVPDAAPPQVYSNPPGPEPLPTWESVRSGHPDGATNPPSPVLVVTQDGLTCYKAWRSGMRPPDMMEEQYGGWVIEAPDPNMGTEVICPPQAAEVIAAYRAAQHEAKKDDKRQ